MEPSRENHTVLRQNCGVPIYLPTLVLIIFTYCFLSFAPPQAIHLGQIQRPPPPPPHPRPPFPWLHPAPHHRDHPSFPQWRFVTDRHGPARVSRPAAMASPLHCAGAMEDAALGRPIRRSCESHIVEVSPLNKGYPFAAAFAAERAAWARASVGLDISDPASVSGALACLLAPSAPSLQGSPCPLTPPQLEALKELLASSYVPPSTHASTAGTAATGASPSPLSAEGLVAAVTTVYVTAHSAPDASAPRVTKYYHTALAPEALALEAISTANGSSAAVVRGSRPLRAVLAAVPVPFAGGVPLRAPSPASLVRLPTSSPLLLTLLGDDAHTYYGDGLPTGLRLGNTSAPARSAPLSNVLSSREATAVASFDGRRQSALSVVSAVRAAASMSGHYRRIADGLGELQALLSPAATNHDTKAAAATLESSLRPTFAPPYPPTYLSSQGAVALTDRLVRLGPSGNAHYSDVLVEGMRSAVRSAVGVNHSAASSSLPLPGLLSKAPKGVRASPEDALGGNWNMSDLPPWLRIPSFVNTAECLHPATASALPPGGAQPPAQGDNLYEEPRSVLIIGPSHLRNIFDDVCRQLFGSARLGNASNGGRSAELCRTKQSPIFYKHILRQHVFGGDRSYPYPIPLAFHWMSIAPYRTIEVTAERLMAELGLTVPSRADPTNVSAALKHRDGIVAAMARSFPSFTGAAMADGAEDGHDETFTYSSLLLRSRRGDFDALKGLFTHVIYAGGVWASALRDLSMPEHTETASMSIDLIREIFEPKKIILYNQHSWHGARPKTPTANAYDGRPFVPLGHFNANECTASESLTKYRDAHICAAYEPARARVRRAFAAELRRERERGEEAAVASGHRLKVEDESRRLSSEKASTAHPSSSGVRSESTGRGGVATPDGVSVEIFDAFVSTMAVLPRLMSDEAGHHYGSLVREAIVQRILRDHVCPPRFVMAVRGDGASLEAEGERRRARVDYANSGLPWRFPFPDGVDRVAIRVRSTSVGSAERMPTLSSRPSKSVTSPAHKFEIHDLFPLFKVPIPVVSEGLCRAIFDHPYGDVNSHFRVVRRDPSFGLRGVPSAGDRSGKGGWWRSVPSALPPSVPSKPQPFIHPSPVQANLFPLHVPPHPYLMAVVRSNPFLPCVMCANIHAGGLVAKSDAIRVDGMKAVFSSLLAARGGFVSPGDALYRSASLAVYSAPRYNVDPLYLLRTRGDYIHEGSRSSDSCVLDVYGAPRKRDKFTGDTRRLPIHVERYGGAGAGDSCLPPPMVEVRARIVVSAYLHARRLSR